MPDGRQNKIPVFYRVNPAISPVAAGVLNGRLCTPQSSVDDAATKLPRRGPTIARQSRCPPARLRAAKGRHAKQKPRQG
jgi:hypothetical protein